MIFFILLLDLFEKIHTYLQFYLLRWLLSFVYCISGFLGLITLGFYRLEWLETKLRNKLVIMSLIKNSL